MTSSHPTDTYNLRIHFAPSTACVDIEITETTANKLIDALGRHGNGEVTLQISRCVKVSLMFGSKL